MNSNELRIGNWVLLDWENVYFSVNINTLAYITRSEKLNKEHPFKPIQLTEEILLKCGFEKSGRYTFICNTALMQLELHVVSNKLLHSILAIEVKYLHQLQNLYFALTNQDLKIEL